MRRVALWVLLLTASLARADVATAPIGNREEVLQPPYLLGSWTQMAQIYPARRVSRAGPVRELPVARRQMGTVRYDYGDAQFTLDDYLRRNDVTSLLVIKDGAIVFETYRMGATATTAFTSWSMGKSLTSTLLGIAIERGLITSENDFARDYVPELDASGYRDVTLRDLLQMSSGVKFVEDYTKPNSKEGQSWMLGVAEQRMPYNDTILWFDEKLHPPGEAFYYASIETQVIGWVVRRATGRPLADLLSEWIWQPMGAGNDASWLLDRPGGMEIASCCVNATTRDYARLGLLMLENGRYNGEAIIPKRWIETATHEDPARPFLHRGNVGRESRFGYQHFWWLWPNGQAFTARGYGGQWLYVNPEENTVIVQTAIYSGDSEGDDWPETVAAFDAIVDAAR
ncbi:MAG: serine hydrolase [Pseudomonadota bacterium]